MNVHYEGASENNNNNRFAIIYYQAKEEQKAIRFMQFVESFGYKTFGEEESIYIEVEDKDDYNYINESFQKYKKKNWAKCYPKRCVTLSSEGAYAICDSDEQFYCYLVDMEYTENAIKSIFERVSGGPDAYSNGFDCVAASVF